MAGDANFSSVVLLLHGDGADNSTVIVDSSLSNKAVTINGNVKVKTDQSKFGGSSIYFDGQDSPSSYLSFADSTDWHFPGAFTIEFFLRPVVEGVNTWLIQQSNEGSPSPVRLDIASTGQLSVLGAFDQSNWAFTSGVVSTTALVTGNWYHVAMTDDGTTFRLFINGNVEASRATWARADNPNPLMIGGGWSSGDRELIGHMDEVRITKGVARYTANFTPPTARFADGVGQVTGTVKDSAGAAAARMIRAIRRSDGVVVAETYTGAGDTYFNNVSLLLTGDGADGAQKCVDRALTPNTVTFSGDAKVSASRKRFANSSFRFDGSGDYLSIPSSSKFSGNGQALTVELQVYPEILNSTRHLIGKRGASNSEWLLLTTATGTLQLTVFTASLTVTAQINAATSLTLNAWNHVAVTRDAGGTWRVFLNGALDGSATESAGAVQTNSSPLVIGRDDAVPGTRDFQGNIEHVRITSGFARYVAAFTPPSDRHPLRASGALGDYTLYTPTLDELTVICLDDAAGTVENDLALRVIPA